MISTSHTEPHLLKLDTQPSASRILYPTRDMYCTPPLEDGTPAPPSPMPRLLQEMASRWCHQSACLVLTIDIYGSV